VTGKTFFGMLTVPLIAWTYRPLGCSGSACSRCDPEDDRVDPLLERGVGRVQREGAHLVVLVVRDLGTFEVTTTR